MRRPQGNHPGHGAVSFDALLPSQMATKAEQIGVSKANMDFPRMFALSVLAGAFIALGAVFSTTVISGTLDFRSVDGSAGLTGALPYGIVKLLGGLAFSLGLMLVVIGGAELFTGNNLIVMAWARRKVSTRRLLWNWLVVWVGNFVGSLATVGLMLATGQYRFGSGVVGATALAIANTKSGLDFFQALVLGIMCNALVCLAVWLTYSARSTTDRILAIIPPITAFVAAGFEHSIANMYFIPLGLAIKALAPESFWTAIGKTAADYPDLTWGNFFVNNLIPVTIGNIIGGAVLVGFMYWFIYLRKQAQPARKTS
ncbi:MAG: formate transporter FocA [Thermoleophilia bacterium]|nr:formate transporter FocA [Thermoleophilia bacterium]